MLAQASYFYYGCLLGLSFSPGRLPVVVLRTMPAPQMMARLAGPPTKTMLSVFISKLLETNHQHRVLLEGLSIVKRSYSLPRKYISRPLHTLIWKFPHRAIHSFAQPAKLLGSDVFALWATRPDIRWTEYVIPQTAICSLLLHALLSEQPLLECVLAQLLHSPLTQRRHKAHSLGAPQPRTSTQVVMAAVQWLQNRLDALLQPMGCAHSFLCLSNVLAQTASHPLPEGTERNGLKKRIPEKTLHVAGCFWKN